MLRRVVVGVPVEDDAAAGDLERAGNLDGQPADLDAELARHAEGGGQVATAGDRAQRREDIHRDVEGAKQAGEFGGDAAAALRAAEAQARHIHADGHRQHQLAVLELGLGQAHRRPLQRQRAQVDGVGCGAGGGHGGDGEDLVAARGGECARAGADAPAAGHHLHVDLAGDEGLLGVDAGTRGQEVTVGVTRDVEHGGDHGAVGVARQVGRTGAGDLELVAVDAGGVDDSAGRADEGHVDVALRIERGQARGRAVGGTGQDRVRLAGRRRGARANRRVEGEAFDLGGAVGAARVRPGGVDEGDGHADAVGAGVAHRVLESLRHDQRIKEGAVVGGVGELDDIRVADREPGDGCAVGARHRDQELGGGIEDRGLVQTDAVRVLVGDGHVGEVVDADDRGRGRVGQLGGQRAQARGRRGDGRALAEDRVAGNADVLKLEALGSAEVEACRAAKSEGFLQSARRVRDRDRHRGLRHVDVDAPGRRAREGDRAAHREDAAGADGDRGGGVDLAGLVEAGAEFLELGGRGELHAHAGGFANFVDQPVAVVVAAVAGYRHGGQRIGRHDDGLVERNAGVVHAHRDRTADGESIQAHQAGLAVGDHGVARGGARRGRPLDDADGGVGDEQADRVGVEVAVGVAQGLAGRQGA